MAEVVHGVTLASTDNNLPYTTGSFTPAADDLLVCFVSITSSVSAGVLTDSQGLGWHEADSQTWATDANKAYVYVAEALAANAAMTVTFDPTADDGANGCIIFVARVSGMTKVGAEAALQAVSNTGAATTPTVVFSTVTTTNPTLVFAARNDDEATTEPTGWTERGDTTYLTPQTGGEYASRDSGFTGTTVTWGASVDDNFVTLGIELDASAGGPTEVPLGLVTEAETAQGATALKTVVLGQPSETDTAQAITVRKTVALGLPTETNTAQAFTALKAVALGLPSETDTALSITPQFVVPLGQATETDSALAITVRKTVAIGIATETDTALPITVDDGSEEVGGRTLALLHAGS